jgi:uncharacterized membrane protein YjgN (DUF898 family)
MTAYQPATGYEPGPRPQLDFRFDGGAATYWGVRIAGFLITACTLGICYPWAVRLTYSWRTNHTIVNGWRLQFTGSAIELFGYWIKWLLLIIITLGIYGFWVHPRIARWQVEHQAIDQYVG